MTLEQRNFLPSPSPPPRKSRWTLEVKDELLQKSQMPLLHKYDSIDGSVLDEEDEQEHDDPSNNQEEIDDPESPLLRANTKEAAANPKEDEENEETEELKIENVRGQCPVCDIWDSTENIRKHAVKHFEVELKEFTEESYDLCPSCPWDFGLALNHLALEHGWIDKLLNDQSMIAEKRKELKCHSETVKDDVSGENSKVEPGFAGSIQNIFYCDLCDIAFISEEFVIDHIRKYHKILKKDLKQFVTDHCL